MIDICISSHRKYPFNIISIYLIGNVFLLKFIFFFSQKQQHICLICHFKIFSKLWYASVWLLDFCVWKHFLTVTHSWWHLFILFGWLFVYFLPFWTDVILLLNCVCFLHIILYTICSLSIYFSCHFVFVSLLVFVWTIRINFHIYHCAYSSYTHTHTLLSHTIFVECLCFSLYFSYFCLPLWLSFTLSLCLSISLSFCLFVSLFSN